MTSISKFSWIYEEPEDDFIDISCLVALKKENEIDVGYRRAGRWWNEKGCELNVLAWIPLQ